jgi:Holliday junction resolvasome RuvABC endonuclease subunit
MIKLSTMKFIKPINHKKLLICVDIALNKSGVAVMDNEKNVYATLLLNVIKSKSYYSKLDEIYQMFTSVFDEILNNNPDAVTLILEDRLKHGWSGATLASIEGARVTAYHAFRHSCKSSQISSEVVLYDPGIIKKHFTGKKTSQKSDVKKSAEQKNPIIKKYDQEDVLDAIYLGLYHVDLSKRSSS